MFELVPKHLLSRLLYSNPVCFLCTNDVDPLSGSSSAPTTNIMTVSWITTIDNQGTFIMSLNANRHTVTNLFPESTTRGKREGIAHENLSKFTLSVAIHGHEDVLKQIGSISGGDDTIRGKKAHLSGLTLSTLVKPSSQGIGKKRRRMTQRHEHSMIMQKNERSQQTLPPKLKRNEEEAEEEGKMEEEEVDEEEEKDAHWEVLCVSGKPHNCCPAHLACVVERVLSSSESESIDEYKADNAEERNDSTEDKKSIRKKVGAGHLILQCKIVFGRVDPRYWHKGKVLAPPSLELPGLLSFLGSGLFAEMRPILE